ncbi:DUF7359 domain-containing protein [Oceanobacillus kimchii]|uniref:Peptidase S74 domain-containing protein n=1 Tax=Oceanobacillus kimchii TaxID=746691 RepID=A0ABQ5TGX4_9BACI|nr:phage tail protein [Oceanobacillus kimchii]GLO66123.1 hypothetical protein MACH08_19070 [Oceanobacillus kimchii]
MFPIDKTLKPHELQLYLAKPNKQIIGKLKYVISPILSVNDTSIHELSFRMPYTVDIDNELQRTPNIDKIKEKYYIKAVYNNIVEWFVITQHTKSSNNSEEKAIESRSLGYIFRYDRMIGYSTNSSNCLMVTNDVLKGTGWQVGYINPEFNLEYRQFDVSSKTKLDFLNEIKEAFDAILIFDTINKTINFYKKEEVSKYKGLNIGYGKYIQSIEDTVDSDEIITRLFVTGNNGLTFNAVNPTGQSYIDDFSYFLYPFEQDEDGNIIRHSDSMDDDVCVDLVKYNNYVSSRKGEFSSLLEEKRKLQEDLFEEENKLVELKSELQIILDSIQIAKTNGTSTSELNNQRKRKNNEVQSVEDVISDIKNSIDSIDSDTEQLRKDLEMEGHFSPTTLDKLRNYIHIGEWSDDNKIDANDLYESGLKRIKEINSPPINVTTNIVNFFEVVEEYHNWDRLNIYDIIRINHDKLDTVIESTISSIQFDFDNKSIDLSIADSEMTNRVRNEKDIYSRMMYTVSKLNTDYNKRKINWETTAYNFNRRNDRISEIPALPTLNENSLSHVKNDDGSVNMTMKWDFPDYEKTEDNSHNIDGFIIYLHHSREDEPYQFGSQMATETLAPDITYNRRSYTFPSIPSNLYYTIGIRSYRRVGSEIHRDGILMSDIVYFNSSNPTTPSFQEVAAKSIMPLKLGELSNNPYNDTIPYQPEKEVDVQARLNGSKYSSQKSEPENPKVDDVWIDTNINKVKVWDGDKWSGDKHLEGVETGLEDTQNKMSEFERKLREELEKSAQELEESQKHIDSELDRIENEVVPDIEKSIKDTYIPRQEYPPEHVPDSGMWVDLSQQPPRTMRWNGEEWVGLAPNEEEINEQIDKIVDSAKQEYKDYTNEEIQKERDRIQAELDEKTRVLNEKVEELVSSVTSKADMEWVNEQLALRGSGIEQSPTPPENPADGLLWMDTSSVPNILKRWNGEKWVKSSPTEAGELGAYTFKEVDEALDAKVSSDTYMVDKDGILSELESNESRITQTEKDIQSSVKQEIYEVDKQGFIERFEGNETSITQNATAITAKASQEELDIVNNTVIGHTTEIELLATGLRSKVESTYVDNAIHGVRSDMENHSTLIDQNAEQIRLQAESITNISGDITSTNSRIDVLSTEITSKVERIEFNNTTGNLSESISEVRQLANGIESTVRNIQIGGRNIAAVNRVNTNQGSLSDYVYRLTRSSGSSNPYLRISREYFELDSDYVATFKVRKISGTVFSMAGHFTSFNGGTTYRDGIEVSSGSWNVGDQNYPNDTETHQYEVHFRTPSTFPTDSAPYWYLQPNRSDYGEDYVLEIWDFQIEKGNKATGWQPAFEDADERMTIAESTITQLEDDITFKVDRDGVSNAININTQGVLIDANKLDITGIVSFINRDGSTGTLIDGDKILTNSITASQLHVDNIFGNSAVIAKIQSDSVLTANLSATKITTGTLNADNVSIINLSATSITAGTLDASKVNIQNLNASSIKTGVLKSIEIEGVNITGSRVASLNSNGEQITIENGIIKFHGENKNTGYIRPAVIGDTTSSFGLVSMATNLSLGFDEDGQFGGTSKSVASWDQNARRAIIAGSDNRDWNGILELRSSFSDRDGNRHVPKIYIDNSTTSSGTRWGSVMVYSGRNNNSPTSNSRYGFEVWQYQGSGDGSATQIFKTDYSTYYGNYSTEIADQLSIGYSRATNERLRIKYDPNGDSSFSTLGTDNYWNTRMKFPGRGSSRVDFPYGLGTSSWGTGRGFAIMLSSNLEHVVTANADTNVMTLYPQRYSGEDVFKITSHHQKGSFRDDLRLSISGTLYVPATYGNTTTNSANIRVGTSAGHFTRNTSLREFKLDIESAQDPYRILQLEARTWYDKGDVERYADAMHKKEKGEAYSLDAVEHIKRIGGLVAEEVVEAELETYADYDENGKLNGVAYDRLWTLLIPIVRDHNELINRLQRAHSEEIARLENRISELEKTINP